MSSNGAETRTDRRAELLERIGASGRRFSNAAVMFHTAVGERLGIGASDWKTLDLLDRFGPLTAGELVRHSGLAPASVTGVIDRLERRGYVHRTRDEADRRKVVVALNKEPLMAAEDPFADLVSGLNALYDEYSDAELELITGFLDACARVQTAATAELSGR